MSGISGLPVHLHSRILAEVRTPSPHALCPLAGGRAAGDRSFRLHGRLAWGTKAYFFVFMARTAVIWVPMPARTSDWATQISWEKSRRMSSSPGERHDALRTLGLGFIVQRSGLVAIDKGTKSSKWGDSDYAQ